MPISINLAMQVPREPQGSLKELATRMQNSAFVTEMDRDPRELAKSLDEIARWYLDRKNEFDRAPTRGQILHELDDLLALIGNLRRRRIHTETCSDHRKRSVNTLVEDLRKRVEILSPYTINALFGEFPAPSKAVVDAKTKKDVLLLIPNHPAIEAAARRSFSAYASTSGRPVWFKSIKPIGPRPPGEPLDMDCAKEFLVSQGCSPDTLRRRIHETKVLLQATFQTYDQGIGLNPKVLDGIVPSPDWMLACDVLHVLWPAKRIPLNRMEAEAVRNVILETKYYAIGKDAEKLKSKRTVNLFDPNILSQVHTLRHRIATLTEAIEVVEERLSALYRRHQQNPRNVARRAESIRQVVIHPLDAWCDELKRRLDQGDYRAWKRNIRRPTGPVLKVPAWPKLNRDMSLQKRTNLLIQAAKPLRNQSWPWRIAP